jgi:hypothetical protein
VTKRIVCSCLACALCAALAACGSSSRRSSGRATAASTNGYRAKLDFSECMRSHGMPNFPDPGASGGNATGSSNSFDGIMVPPTVNEQSPAFQAAASSCKQLLSGGSPPPPISASQRDAALAQARCMRKHGVPNLPDPTFSSREIGVDLGGVNPQSPAFKRVRAACGTH